MTSTLITADHRPAVTPAAGAFTLTLRALQGNTEANFSSAAAARQAALHLRAQLGPVRGERALRDGYEWRGAAWTLTLTDPPLSVPCVITNSMSVAAWHEVTAAFRRDEARRAWAARWAARQPWAGEGERREYRILSRRTRPDLPAPHRPQVLRALHQTYRERRDAARLNLHLPGGSRYYGAMVAKVEFLERMMAG